MNGRRVAAGFSLVELLVVLAILAVLLGLILAGVQRAREAASRVRCVNNLKQIGLALHGYHDTQGSLPPGVTPADDPSYPYMSWNTRLLPYLEQQALWQQTLRAYALDKNFNHDPPHVGLSTVLEAYGCPSDPRSGSLGYPTTIDPQGYAFTDYLGVTGVNSRRKDGVLFVDSQVRFADVTDGLSNTLAVGERPPSTNVFGVWYAGAGQSGDGATDMLLGVREQYFGGGLGNCRNRPYDYGPGRPTNACDALHFWSFHAGGANFLLADGSVHFLPYATAPLMPALATRSGGEPVTLPD
jgi:prepilin-type N-terminal cleavage/methylation domain-containing protein/prepilin-type processing-associated H-X9-DG protein